MAGRMRDPRPVPAQVVVVAFPTAYGQDPWPGKGSPPKSDFFIVLADSKDVVLPSRSFDWLTLEPATSLGRGMSQVDYSATDNTLATRRLPVPVEVKGTRYTVDFLQQPGELVQTELVRTLNSPLNIDCLIAICFIAQQIQKIPIPPIKLLVTIVAVLAIVALGFVVSALRHAFVGVPEPKPLSTDTNGVPIVVIPGVAVSQGLPLANIAAEDQTIALQTVKEIYWLLKEVG